MDCFAYMPVGLPIQSRIANPGPSANRALQLEGAWAQPGVKKQATGQSARKQQQGLCRQYTQSRTQVLSTSCRLELDAHKAMHRWSTSYRLAPKATAAKRKNAHMVLSIPTLSDARTRALVVSNLLLNLHDTHTSGIPESPFSRIEQPTATFVRPPVLARWPSHRSRDLSR